MKNSYRKILDNVRAALLSPAQQGISGEEVKGVIVQLLSPYFVNKDILEKTAIPILAPEAVNISRIINDAWAKPMFLRVLKEYHQAAKVNKDTCFLGIASWDQKIAHGSSEYVSLLNLHSSLDELLLNDFRYEVFRNIGALIEANLQPHLKELLLQIRIRRGKTNPDQGLDNMRLGVAIEELCKYSGYEELFAPPPWGIRLNQWRNMAQHHKTRIEKDRIIGAYSVGNQEQEVIFTREELFRGFKRIHSVLSLIKGARAIFFCRSHR